MTERFELLDKIGSGGMADVYRARDTQTGDIVALKLLDSRMARDPGYVARFEREVEVIRRIDSPYVVKVFGYGTREGIPYIAMELVEGGALKQLIAARGRMTWAELRPLATQVATGLVAAHRAGVIHRDIKPSNILLTKDGTAKLADFGIARAMDMTALTGTSTMLGTPAYMAPDLETTEQSDLYSLGVCLYEALAGDHPFKGDSQHQVILGHLRTPPDLARIDTEARGLVGWLLEKEPARRPRDAEAVIAVLAGARPPAQARSREIVRRSAPVSSDALSRTAPAVDDRPSEVRGWRPAALVIGVLGVLVVVVVAVVLSMSRDGATSVAGDASAEAGSVGGRTTTARIASDTRPTPTPTLTPNPNASPTPGASATATVTLLSFRQADQIVEATKEYRATLKTNKGDIVIKLNNDVAPNTVNNFVFLAQNHFFDGITFHRVLPGSIIQSGDPTATGTGGPGYTTKDEPNTVSNRRGTIAMAKTRGATDFGSQWFINVRDNPSLDFNTTASDKFYPFGVVESGMDVVDAIGAVPTDSSNKPRDPVIINTVTMEFSNRGYYNTYTIKSGDICGTIAESNGLTVAQLLQLNGMTEDDCTRIQLGQVLKVK